MPAEFPRLARSIHELVGTWPDHWWEASVAVLACGCLAPVPARCPHGLYATQADALDAEGETFLGIPRKGDPARRRAVRWWSLTTQAPRPPTFGDVRLTPGGVTVEAE